MPVSIVVKGDGAWQDPCDTQVYPIMCQPVGVATFDATINPQAIYIESQRKTYIVYMDANWDPKISYYDHESKMFVAPVLVGDSPPEADMHGAPALAIDSTGYFHVFYGSHGGPQLYKKSVRPFDITEWSAERQLFGSATYPNVIVMPNDDIIVLYRGVQLSFAKSIDGGTNWTTPKTIWNPSPYGIYPFGYALGDEHPTPSIHFIASKLDQTSAVRLDLYYLVSHDGGDTWETTRVFNSGTDWCQGKDIKLLNGRPCILFMFLDKFMFAKLQDDGTWNITDVAQGDHPFDSGSLEIIDANRMNAYLIMDGTTDGFHAIRKRGGEVQKWSTFDGGLSWQKTEDITANSAEYHYHPKLVVNGNPELKLIWTHGDSSPTDILYYAVSPSNVGLAIATLLAGGAVVGYYLYKRKT